MSTWQTRGERLVVVGGGQAAVQTIEVARQQGFEGSITLISDESVLPYQRPPLSKQYLSGLHDRDWLLYRPERFYSKYAVSVRLARRVIDIQRTVRTVVLDDGTALPYDKLLLATGARARALQVSGADAEHVYSIRTLADVDKLRARLATTKKVVIVGGGFIGLETAAVLVQMGIGVTLLAAQDRLIPKFASADLASFLRAQHELHGVQVVLSAEVVEIRHKTSGDVEALLANGSAYAGDMILVGIGAIPNVELAQAAGLDCVDGIVVDELARTSDPAILAAGDCTNHPNPLLDRRLRLETVHNAVEQGRTAGATLAGKELPYIQSPWVWSDQYQLRLQSVGVADGYDRTVLRGSVATAQFSIFYYRGDDLLAVNCINQPLVFGAGRRALNERLPLPAEQAADPSFDIARLPPRRARLDFDIPWPSKSERRPALAWGHE